MMAIQLSQKQVPADNQKICTKKKHAWKFLVSGLKTLENYENGFIYKFEQDYDDYKKVFQLRRVTRKYWDISIVLATDNIPQKNVCCRAVA